MGKNEGYKAFWLRVLLITSTVMLDFRRNNFEQSLSIVSFSFKHTNRYGMDSSGIQTSVGARYFPFSTQSTPGLGPTQPPVQCVQGLFPSGKADGALRWQTTPDLAPRSRRGRNISLLPLCPCKVRNSETFTFIYLKIIILQFSCV
jgi:hypothetical protein